MNLSLLISRAAQYGIEGVEDADGPLIPFTLVLDANPDLTERTITQTRHVSEYLEEGLESARNSVKPDPNATLYAIAWDGFVTVDGRKWDAILIEAGESDSPDGVIFAQRYEPEETGLFTKKRRNVAVGGPLEVRKVPSRLWSDATAAQ